MRSNSFSFADSAITPSLVFILSSLSLASFSVCASVWTTDSSSFLRFTISRLTSSISRVTRESSSLTPSRFSSTLDLLLLELANCISLAFNLFVRSSNIFSRSFIFCSSFDFSSSRRSHSFSWCEIVPVSSLICESLFIKATPSLTLGPPEINPCLTISPERETKL